MSKLTDLDPMPFGKYAGKPLQDVPAEYFHWLWQQGLKRRRDSLVADYIKENLEALKKEYPDGIWT